MLSVAQGGNFLDAYNLATEAITSTILYLIKLSQAHPHSEEGIKISPLDEKKDKEFATYLIYTHKSLAPFP